MQCTLSPSLYVVISQTRHAKNCGRSITLHCPQHGTGITEITMPPAPVYVLPSRPSAVGKSCSVCKTPIRTRYADLAYHCANPFCDNVCHLAAMCSGFVNIHIKATNSTWLDLYNVYLPNTSTQHNSLNTSLIKPGPSSLILGDLNGHSQMLESLQPQDQRDDKILDWICDNEIHILNDGSATRNSRIW